MAHGVARVCVTSRRVIFLTCLFLLLDRVRLLPRSMLTATQQLQLRACKPMEQHRTAQSSSSNWQRAVFSHGNCFLNCGFAAAPT